MAHRQGESYNQFRPLLNHFSSEFWDLTFFSFPKVVFVGRLENPKRGEKWESTRLFPETYLIKQEACIFILLFWPNWTCVLSDSMDREAAYVAYKLLHLSKLLPKYSLNWYSMIHLIVLYHVQVLEYIKHTTTSTLVDFFSAHNHVTCVSQSWGSDHFRKFM